MELLISARIMKCAAVKDISSSIAALVLLYGGWLHFNGKLGMDGPAFVVYLAFYWRVLEPAKQISKAYARFQAEDCLQYWMPKILSRNRKLPGRKRALTPPLNSATLILRMERSLYFMIST